MEKLTETDREELHRGMVLCLPGYETDPGPLAYILIDLTGYYPGLALVQATGYHAGTLYRVLPPESRDSGRSVVSVAWLKENWERIEDCEPDEVYILDRLELSDAVYQMEFRVLPE